jgi:hypothetical protein
MRMSSNDGKPGLSDDLAAYPLLVTSVNLDDGETAGESVGRASAESGAGMDQLVTSTLRQVLGWTPNAADAKGFTGALTQSFDLIDREGHVDFSWKQRSFAVLTDLEGGVTGAQASVYTRAKDALERALPLLDALYPLSLHADPEDTSAIKALVREHLMTLVGELGRLGGPRLARADQLFELLIGAETAPNTLRNADTIEGELGQLRDRLGVGLFKTRQGQQRDRDLVNTVGEEENQTNYRILADYVISLHATWLANRSFFVRSNGASPFFGTQLVHLSRQLAVIAGQIREVRFAFTSVMIGPRERQTLDVVPGKPHYQQHQQERAALSEAELEAAVNEQLVNQPDDEREPIFLEELLSWIESFARDEGPRLVRDGGKFGVQQAFTPIAIRLKRLVAGIRCPRERHSLPRGYFHPRVAAALFELDKQLAVLIEIATPIKHDPGHSGRSNQQAAE